MENSMILFECYDLYVVVICVINSDMSFVNRGWYMNVSI